MAKQEADQKTIVIAQPDHLLIDLTSNDCCHMISVKEASHLKNITAWLMGGAHPYLAGSVVKRQLWKDPREYKDIDIVGVTNSPVYKSTVFDDLRTATLYGEAMIGAQAYKVSSFGGTPTDRISVSYVGLMGCSPKAQFLLDPIPTIDEIRARTNHSPLHIILVSSTDFLRSLNRDF